MVQVLRSTGDSTHNLTLCYDNWDADWSSRLCSELGYQYALSTRIVPTTNLQGPWLVYSSMGRRFRVSDFKEVDKCASSYALALDCKVSGE